VTKILFLGSISKNCLGGVKHLANVGFVAERERNLPQIVVHRRVVF
jgi:hypothetical protein